MNFALSKREVLDAQAYFARPVNVLALAVLVALVAAVTFPAVAISTRHHRALSVGGAAIDFVTVAALLVLFYVFVSALFRRWRWRQYRATFSNCQYRMFDERIVLDHPAAGLHVEVAWSDIRGVVIHKSAAMYFLVLWRPMLVYPIPRRAFMSQPDEARFVQLARDHDKLGSRGAIWRRRLARDR